jgi:DNA-binding response OmpR family regulator
MRPGLAMNATVLAVEDNAIVARPLARFLAHSGYDVRHVDSCASARALQEVFDVGVFDIELADGSGIDLCVELRARGRIRGAIFYTGIVDAALLERAAQVAVVIRKTQSAEALRRAICAALAQSVDNDTGGCCSTRRYG